MKREKLITCLWATALAFGLSFGAVACTATAFDMEISLAAAAGILLPASAVCAVCFCLPLGAAPLGIGALALWVLWRKGILVSAAEAILNRLSRQYARAYGWQIIRWTVRTAPEMEPDLLPALCILGAVVALLTAWSVCRGKPVLPAVLTSLPLLAVCVVVTDTVPAAGWLYLYLLSLCVLLVTSVVRRTAEGDANRLSLVTVPAAALALLVLFLLNPAQSYKGEALANHLTDAVRQIPVIDVLLDRMGLQQPGVTVTPNNGVDLTAVGKRSNYGAKVLEITSSYSGTIYLRSTAMDVYDGLTWRSSGDLMADLTWPVHDYAGKETVQITTRYAHKNLYTPYYVQGMLLSSTATGLENTNGLTEYTLEFSPMPNQMKFLTMYPDAKAGIGYEQSSKLQQNIRLDNTVRKWADKRVDRILKGVENPYHMAQAIGEYVRNSADYDLSTDRMPQRKTDFARWFLEDSDTGYCVHFATAATVLLQTAGIPARYVTGYMVQAEAGKTIEVTADMAHAWAEYYLPGFGWTILEATPAQALVQPAQTQPAEETDSSVPEQTLPENDGATDSQTDTQSDKTEKKQLPWELLWILLLPLAVVGLAEGQYRLRRGLGQRAYARATEKQKAVLCWQQLVKLSRLAGTTPDQDAYGLVQKAVFSQHTLTAQELQQLEAAVQNTRRQLQSASLPKRVLYRLVYAI